MILKFSRPGAYPDAFEFKEGDYGYIPTIYYGYDKENGFKINTPYDRSIMFNEKGDKIHRIIESFNTAHFTKYNNSFSTIENGKIYKDHKFIGVVRRMMSNLKEAI